MPIYEYKCGKCGKVSEIVVGVVHSGAKIKCSHCGSEQLEKIIPSTFAVATSRKAASNATSCCGANDPCDDPKRCCNDH